MVENESVADGSGDGPTVASTAVSNLPLPTDHLVEDKNAWQLANEALKSLTDVGGDGKEMLKKNANPQSGGPPYNNGGPPHNNDGPPPNAGGPLHNNSEHHQSGGPPARPWYDPMGGNGGEYHPYNNWYPPPPFGNQGYNYLPNHPGGMNGFDPPGHRMPPYNMSPYGGLPRRPMYPPNGYPGYRPGNYPGNSPGNRFNAPPFNYNDNYYRYPDHGGYQQQHPNQRQRPPFYHRDNGNFTSFENNGPEKQIENNHCPDNSQTNLCNANNDGNGSYLGNKQVNQQEVELEKPKSFADALKNNKILENKKKLFQKGNNAIVFKKATLPKNIKPSWTSKGFSEVQDDDEEGNEENEEEKMEVDESEKVRKQSDQGNQVSSESDEQLKKNPKEWPDAMKEWVRCSFEQCETENMKDKLEKRIKPYINQVIRNLTAWTIDWNVKPLFEVSPERDSSYGKRRNPSFRTYRSRSNSGSRSHSRSASPPSPPRRIKSRNRSDSDDSGEIAVGHRSIRSRVGSKRVGKKGRTKSVVREQFKVEDSSQTLKKKQDRASRFQSVINKTYYVDDSPFYNSFGDDVGEDVGIDLEFHINGTCKEVTKPYLRLTAAPDPSTVRPVEILEQSLEVVKERWRTKQDYHFVCEQMKSIRQDLTVQGVKNDFTVKVYECHARIALEKDDRTEFNQCQTCLKSLYDQGIAGEVAEFTAYNMLYYIYTKETSDLNSCLASLTKELKKDELVHHALAVQSAVALSNYSKFFKLYASSPRMSGYLMDMFIDRERVMALKRMVKTYKPSLSESFVTKQLAFSDDTVCHAWLEQANVKFDSKDPTKIDCKASVDV